MTSIPTGTVTFLFTDVEVSTPLWAKHPDTMGNVIERHDALVREIVEAHGGYVFKTVGDEFCAAFSTPNDAVATAIAVQAAISSEDWGSIGQLRVRMGIHTGAAEQRHGDYFGLELSRVARIRGLAHGGQVLVSSSTRELCAERLPPGAALRDLGVHRLRGLESPEHIYQLVHPGLESTFPRLDSSEGPPSNLPGALSSFVGRESELEEVERLLATHRLVTLTGPGGSGKTRLAVEAARRLAPHYTHGAWLVELASLSTRESVAPAVVAAFGLREEPGGSLLATLVEHLRPKQLLLLLDNCEHLLDACAELADAVLRACPGVRVLATGRESLGITGELRWPVPSLTLPSGDVLSPAEASRYEAVQLFVERGAEVEPGFALTEENVAAVAHICSDLDGMPLAIELAARRLGVLPPAQIAARMHQQIELLTTGSRTSLPRQQTLKAAIDWSYEPLEERERKLLRHLAVFAGGWTLEAAVAVCAGDPGEAPRLLDDLSLLVDRSLVVKEQREDNVRYHLLEMIRQYATDRLVESEEDHAARERHRRWCQQLADEADPHLRSREMPLWLGRLQQEQDNLREAITSAAPHSEDAVDALRLAASLGRFWSVAGYWTEGRRLLEDALAGAPDAHPALRARAHYALATLAFSQADHPSATANLDLALSLLPPAETLTAADALHLQGMVAHRHGDLARAVASLEESVERYRAAGDRQRLNAGLNNLGLVVESTGDYVRAASLYEESLAIKRELGDELGAAGSLHNLGAIALHLGDVERARALQEETLAIGRRIGNTRAITTALTELGKVALKTGDFPRAGELYREALQLLSTSGDRVGAVECIEGLGYVAAGEEDLSRAAHLLAAAGAARDSIGAPLAPAALHEWESAVELLRSRMGHDGFGSARDSGHAMSLEEAIDLALRR